MIASFRASTGWQIDEEIHRRRCWRRRQYCDLDLATPGDRNVVLIHPKAAETDLDRNHYWKICVCCWDGVFFWSTGRMRVVRIDRALMGSVPSERRVAPSARLHAFTLPGRESHFLTVFSISQLLQFSIRAVVHIFISNDSKSELFSVRYDE